MSVPQLPFALPDWLARIGPRLPQWPHALALCAGLNGALALKLLQRDDLAILDNRHFSVQVSDAGIDCRFTYRNGRFLPRFGQATAPDVRFRGRLATFLKLASRQEDPDTLFFHRELVIEGDTELGLTIKNLLDAVEWPSWTAHLPRLGQ